MNKYGKLAMSANLGAARHLLRSRGMFRRACKKAFDAAEHVESDALAAIPEVALGEIMGSRQVEVRVPVAAYADGMLPYDQALVLASLLVLEQPREVLEIGTFMGHSTKLMAMNLPEARIHTVDLPLDTPLSNETGTLQKDDFHLIARRVVGKEFRDEPCASRIQQHLVDTAKWDFKDAGAPTFFFIDGSHTYDYAKNDSEKCLALTDGRPATFVWHDCDDTHPGVIQFLLEWRAVGREVRRIWGTPLAYWKIG